VVDVGTSGLRTKVHGSDLDASIISRNRLLPVKFLLRSTAYEE
jgi:hypothetical protein